MLFAFARLVRERPAGMPTVLMASTVNEENGFSGVKALCRMWDQPGSVVTRRPDAAVISEPTELSVVVAHKGVVRWRLHTRGRAAHASQPNRGENAIYRMAPVLAALERYAGEVVPQLGEHPLCGRPTLNVGTVQGGLSVNTVPDRATIEIDRRVLPGEDPQAAYEHVVDYLARSLGRARVDRARPALHADDRTGAITTMDRWPTVCWRPRGQSSAGEKRSAFPTAPTPPRPARPEFPRSSLDRARSPKPTPPTNGWRSINSSWPPKSTTASRRADLRPARRTPARGRLH